MEEKKLTGYASIDKPWLKYYSQEAIQAEFTPMSMYELMKTRNMGHSDEIAISYFGINISYAQMLARIEDVAAALIGLGIERNENVLISLPNIPEVEYLIYALNKIGAVVCPIDPRSGVNLIHADLIKFKTKIAFVLDILLPQFAPFIGTCGLERIITVSAMQSLGTADYPENKVAGVLPWPAFLANKVAHTTETVFTSNAPAVIIHTGGSTGVPKSVILSNENCNALMYQMIYGEYGFRRQMTFLNILPPFVALGLNNAMHLAACLGLTSIMIPSIEPEDFPKLLEQYKPSIVMGGPLHFKLLTKSDYDLSFLEICCSGGDKMPRETQEKVQMHLKSHNAKANFWLGYGATETSAGSTCMKDNCFRYEAVGIPYLKNVLEVFDPESGEKIRGYGNIGELRVKAPTMMVGYYGDDESELESVIHTDETGDKWYCTGDLAHFDEDGLVYIDGRIKRIILRRINKIYPAQIESILLQHPAVKECAVVGVPDEDEINIPVANIILEEASKENPDVQNEIREYANQRILCEVADFAVLAGFNFLDALPLTPIGKLDFRSLEKLGIIN